jgi:hypothetical protein
MLAINTYRPDIILQNASIIIRYYRQVFYQYQSWVAIWVKAFGMRAEATKNDDILPCWECVFFGRAISLHSRRGGLAPSVRKYFFLCDGAPPEAMSGIIAAATSNMWASSVEVTMMSTVSIGNLMANQTLWNHSHANCRRTVSFSFVFQTWPWRNDVTCSQYWNAIHLPCAIFAKANHHQIQPLNNSIFFICQRCGGFWRPNQACCSIEAIGAFQ